MDLSPADLKGKVIKDCYEDGYRLIIEFTDGTKVWFKSTKRSVNFKRFTVSEIVIPTIL